MAIEKTVSVQLTSSNFHLQVVCHLTRKEVIWPQFLLRKQLFWLPS